MILTVTLNAALDVTYRVNGVAWGQVNRVSSVAGRAGGKGINVARVRRAMGREAVITGFAGGPTGEAIRREAAAAGMDERLVPIGGESRRTIAIVEPGRATVFNEPGPEVSPQEWSTFLDAFARLLQGSEAVVLSGSLPPGLSTDAYAALIDMAVRAGVPALLDAEGEPLKAGLAAGPSVAKPNRREMEESTGRAFTSVDAILWGANWLREAGAGAGVVTCGADGIVASDAEGSWLAEAPEHLTGNGTGAGDAVAAALAIGLASHRPWPDCLTDAAAAGAAAVLGPLAGDIDIKSYERFRRGVTLQAL